MEIETTRQLLGYDPQDNFFEESEMFKYLNMSDELAEHNVGYVQMKKKKTSFILIYYFSYFLFFRDDRQKSGLRDKSPEDKKKK